MFFNMKMTHQSAAAAAALCMVVLVLCSSGATARVLREGDIFERILGGVTVDPHGTGVLHNTGDLANGAGAAAGNVTVLGKAPGPTTTVALPPIVVDIIPPTKSAALPPCVAVPPVVAGGAEPPIVKGALPPVPACIGAPPRR